MEIEYDSPKVKVLFQDFNKMQKEKGLEITRQIKKRYNQLKAAETFADYLITALGNPHTLTGNWKGHYGINVASHKRLIVEPVATNLSNEELKKCRKIIIKGVEDYHGKKTTIYIP